MIVVAGAEIVTGGAEELADHRPTVGRNTDLGVVVLADIVLVQQDVDDIFGELHANPGSRPIGQVAAQHQRDVAVTHPFEDRILTPDAIAEGHTQGQRVALRESTLGAIAGYHGSAQLFGQADYVIPSAGGMDLFAEEDHGAFGVAKQIPGAFDLYRVTLGDVRVARPEHLDLCLLAEQVGGHLELDGAGTTFTEANERLDKVVRDGLDLIDAGVPVGDGGEHAQLVLGLMGGHLSAAHELGFDVGGHLKDG